MTKNTPTKRAGTRTQPASLWTCPKCSRSFTQVNQRHACGTTDGSDILRNRPESVVRTYAAIEAFVKLLGEIEIVARDRYVLFRSVRIFADLNIMADAVRTAIHLERKVEDPRFIKVVEDRKKVTHVVKLRSESDVDAIKAYLKEAYEVSLK
ncbi:MAG TPA: DUF5655 domain-containing protein [Polyangiaceae bacterium]|nr:DUF5655 domain-containing protein [Polyangiaceae bacterium]